MTVNKDPVVFIEHINNSIKDVEDFTKSVEKEDFLKDKKLQNALIRSIEVIGEAVKNIPLGFRNKYSNIEWTKIAGMRDKLLHHYFGVNLETVWKVVKESIPKLKKDIQDILDKEKTKTI